MPPSLRCGRATLGGRGDRRRDADPGLAPERRCRNARVASRRQLVRAGGASQKPLVASAERPDEAADLLDDFLIALLDLPGDAWPDIAAALPDEVFDRIDRWMEVRLS
jgi:hypothetical protein